MMTIKVRFHGPDNTRGARFVARWRGTQRTVPYHYENSRDDKNEAVSRLLDAVRGKDRPRLKFVHSDDGGTSVYVQVPYDTYGITVETL